LYALIPYGSGRRSLKIIDVASGIIASSHDGFQRGSRAAVEVADGRLLISFVVLNDDWTARAQGMVLFDPATGEHQTSEIAISDLASDFDFQTSSPDGRYWIKSDLTMLPVRDVGPGIAGRFFGGKRERYYGVTVQLWEAFPLRFVRRVVVAWLTVKELPPPIHARAAHDGIWTAIAETTARLDTDPLEAPPRAAFSRFSQGKNEWFAIREMWRQLTRSYFARYRWQADSDAFWMSTNYFLSCVGIDGTLSPRLFLARKGLRKDTRLPVAEYWTEVVPLAGRKARVTYTDGAAVFDGAASGAPHQSVEIAKERDQWVASDPKALIKRVNALKAERKRILIPLSAWTEAGCNAAIDALTAEIGDDFEHSAVEHELKAIFVKDNDEFDERQFFMTALDRFPGTAPAIRRLLERYADVISSHQELFWDGQKGIGVFGHAARALGSLDRSALPTLRRYARLVDTEHECFFALETVPAIIRALGWTHDVIDFVVFVLLVDFYNSLHDHNVVWDKWGLRDAVVQHYQPNEFARRVANEINAGEFWHLTGDHQAQYGNRSMDQLAAQIPEPHEPWVEEFFAELERIADKKRGATVN
jgi:hypothetical protein